MLVRNNRKWEYFPSRKQTRQHRGDFCRISERLSFQRILSNPRWRNCNIYWIKISSTFLFDARYILDTFCWAKRDIPCKAGWWWEHESLMRLTFKNTTLSAVLKPFFNYSMNQEVGISGVQYILIQLPHSNNQDEVAISSSVLMLVSSFNIRWGNEWEILEGSKRKRENFLYPHKTKDEVRHLDFRFSKWAELKECFSSEGSVYESHVDRGDRSCPGYWVSSEVLSWSPVRQVPQCWCIIVGLWKQMWKWSGGAALSSNSLSPPGPRGYKY